MSKPSLSVERLTTAGFEEIGCWELNDARDLAHSIDLPKQAGVYAFAVDDIVQYVGLASRSLHQRLNFYRKPGASQRTNIRLNEIIKGRIDHGTTVRILVAHPPDQEWNGFKVKGAEGLEAGLIAEFDLPRNMRGTQPAVVKPTRSSPQGVKKPQSGVAQKIEELVRRRPGMTELDREGHLRRLGRTAASQPRLPIVSEARRD
jgi:hypothetical protein